MYLEISHVPPVIFFTPFNQTIIDKIDVKIRNVEMTSHGKAFLNKKHELIEITEKTPLTVQLPC